MVVLSHRKVGDWAYERCVVYLHLPALASVLVKAVRGMGMCIIWGVEYGVLGR